MKEIVVRVDIPEELDESLKKVLGKEVERTVKSVLISEHLERLMEGTKDLSGDEIIRLSREFKKRELERLKKLDWLLMPISFFLVLTENLIQGGYSGSLVKRHIW